MKEKEFKDWLEDVKFDVGIIIPVYYSVKENGNIILNEEEILRECKYKINEIKEVLE